MARGGGGFTYAVNVIPVLARRLPETDLLVVLRSARSAESLPPFENLSVHLLPEAGFLELMIIHFINTRLQLKDRTERVP